MPTGSFSFIWLVITFRSTIACIILVDALTRPTLKLTRSESFVSAADFFKYRSNVPAFWSHLIGCPTVECIFIGTIPAVCLTITFQIFVDAGAVITSEHEPRTSALIWWTWSEVPILRTYLNLRQASLSSLASAQSTAPSHSLSSWIHSPDLQAKFDLGHLNVLLWMQYTINRCILWWRPDPGKYRLMSINSRIFLSCDFILLF